MARNSAEKSRILKGFRSHVSTGKADFFARYKMDFVMGLREGAWIYDIDEEKGLYNLHCNGGVFNLGHRNADLIQLLRDGLERYDIGNHHLMSAVRTALADALAERMPGDLGYTIFGTGGGEAADLAIKLARGFTGRRRVVSLAGGYHGHTGLALRAGDPRYREPFLVDPEDNLQIPYGDLDAADQALKGAAALIIESVPATAGILVPEPAYIESLRRICSHRGALYIADEIQTGFGRTGKLWGFEHYGIVPDMVLLGKGMSGGIYPISGTVITPELEKFFRRDPFVHISTFGGAELGALVALKVLEISSDPAFLAHVNLLAETIAERIAELQPKHSGFFTSLRRVGLMMGLEFVSPSAGPLFTKTAYDNNLLMVYANNDTRVVQFLPPLNIPVSDLDFFIPAIDKAMGEARRLLPLLEIKRAAGKLFGGRR
jgi:acetylornithine/succinyldiaminopimelate/putrescine aminotransferase